MPHRETRSTLWTLEGRKPGVEGVPGAADPSRLAEMGDAPIVCAACGAPIATKSDRISAFGAHEHDRMNPNGDLFRIACFARAHGARAIGPSSDEFPWFPNHRWRVLVCGACVSHLGWWFSDGSTSFLGLIAERFAEPP